MKRVFQLMALLIAACIDTHPTQGLTNCAVSSRILLIDPCSVLMAHGKATLTIGMLQRTNGVYFGDYKIKVTPYFFKGEKGRLAIAVSDESLAGIMQGDAQAITGTATTNGKTGKSRHIDAIAMPIDINHGTLKVSFTAGNRKVIFEPAYRFTERRRSRPVGTNVNHTAVNLP
jgi:hypothetical protein